MLWDLSRKVRYTADLDVRQTGGRKTAGLGRLLGIIDMMLGDMIKVSFRKEHGICTEY